MKIRFLSLRHSPRVATLCAALLTVGTGNLVHAAAAPKGTPTPAPTPTATATATQTLTATPAASTAPATPTPLPNYNGQQQADYLAAARKSFVALRTEKSQPFLDAHQELDVAGGISAKGLDSKEAIAARRALVVKNITANDEYLAFIATQEDTYKAELAKTPLVPADVDAISLDFNKNSHTATMVKLRETQRDVLKAGDDMLAAFEKRFGSYTVNEVGKATFKKKSDVSTMNTLGTKFNEKVAELQKLRDELTAAASPSPSPSVAATPAGAATPAPVASPAAAVAPATPTPTKKP